MRYEDAAHAHVPRKLLVYCASSEATGRVGAQIARTAEFDVDVIEEDGFARGWTGTVRARFAAFFGYCPRIRTKKDPSRYDLVVIGTPVVRRSLAPCVRAYLRRHASALPEVAFFCTADARGAWETLRDMRALSGREPVAVFMTTPTDVSWARHRGDMQRFVDTIVEHVTMQARRMPWTAHDATTRAGAAAA
jgi:hypothetical protein